MTEKPTLNKMEITHEGNEFVRFEVVIGQRRWLSQLLPAEQKQLIKHARYDFLRKVALDYAQPIMRL